MTSATRNTRTSELEETLRVSIVFTVKNEERTIRRTIESPLRIGYPDYEVMVVDSGLEYQMCAHRLNLLSEGARS